MKPKAAQAARQVSEHELLRRLQTVDHGAFREIYERHFKATATVAHRFLGSRNSAEDAAQATFIVLWEKSNDIDLPGGSLMPWLATVCRLQCRNIRKKEWRSDHADLADHPTSTSRGTTSKATPWMPRCCEACNPSSRHSRPRTERFFGSAWSTLFSYEAAAQSLGITHSAVRNRLSRQRIKDAS